MTAVVFQLSRVKRIPEEFKQQARKLSEQGKAAFFIPIEILADGGIADALRPPQMEKLAAWIGGETEGWFFLDSVDEARLKEKSVEVALQRVAAKLGNALKHAHILASCRVSDWKGKIDRAAIEEILAPPAVNITGDNPSSNSANHEADDEPLLAPFVASGEETVTQEDPKREQVHLELLAVQLVPLNARQRRALAAGAGVNDADAFVHAIDQQGLEVLAERPGDLLELAEYWKTHGCFGALAEMTEHGVSQKLKEIDNFRPDNNILPSEKARKGVERLAAALTLGKSLTLRTPAQEADPELTAGALDPALILGDDWTSAERNALLRRGIFVPSTYGRVRFHHRSTQEYLAGKWLERIRREGCPLPAIWNLLFAEPHGVETVAPSLRPAAAWLALNDTSLADEIIRREPLMLLQYGDPGSLPLETRKRLLRLYAEKHARGEIANDALDQRALWMFADAELADTIRGVWHLNPRPEFRDALLHLIREGAITGCVDLARAVAHDEDAEDYERIVALQALHRCHDQEGLAHAARQLMASASQASPRLASGFARILFPEMLGVEEILTLIADSLPAQQHSVAGFPYIVDELYERCPDTVSRSLFISGIADLCLTPPFANRHERISERYGTLTEHLVPIARHAIQEWKDREPPPHLVRLLMAIERGERDTGRGDSPPLAQLVQKHARLNWALFWADVEEARCHGDHQGGVTTWWHAQLIDQLWELDSIALSWLLEDLYGRPLVDDQRVALSAIIRIFVKEDRLQVEASGLRELVAGRQELEEDLENCFAPRQPDEALMRSEREYERAKHRRRDNEEKAKASWVAFRGKLLENPSHLRSPAFVGTPEGLNNLHNLTNWLRHRMRKEKNERTAPHWQHLSEGFSLAVAEAYRDGMKALWRITRPERPQRREGGHSTVKWSTVLSYAGVAIEAKESSDWAGCLTAEEAELAARHSCMAEQDYPEWMDALIQAHPTAVLPVLRQALRMEWRSTQERPLFFFYHYASAGEPLLPVVQRELLGVILGKEPEKPDRLESGIRILLQRLDLDAKDRRRAVRIARQRMHRHAEGEWDTQVLCYLACLLFFDFERGLNDFSEWLETAPAQERKPRAETAFSRLFGRDAYVTSLAHAPVQGLEQLLRSPCAFGRAGICP